MAETASDGERLSSHKTANFEEDLVLRNWYSKDPRLERTRILESKDPLLEGSCDWIFDDPSFTHWWESNNNESRVLWIHGDPGKGKTMMMMAIINELSKRLKRTPGEGAMSYFFCQNTIPELRSAEGIMRGLTYVLADSNRRLIKFLRHESGTAAQNQAGGSRSIYELWDTLSKMTEEQSVGQVFLLVDALDECGSPFPEQSQEREDSLGTLLRLLTRPDLGLSQKIKWVLTSRNEPRISALLENLCQDTSLEVNSAKVTAAVDKFVDLKSQQLSKRNRFSSDLHENVRKYLADNAGGTFLWVALVCKELEKRSRLIASETKALLKTFPKDLVPLYDRMLQLLSNSGNAGSISIALKILRIVTLARRPFSLNEISMFAELPVDMNDSLQEREDIKTLVDSCGSFLTVRQDTIYFVHQSAQDYFSLGNGRGIFSAPNDERQVHGLIATRAFHFMDRSLKKNICNLKNPGTDLSEADHTVIAACISPHLEYSVTFGFRHFVLGKNRRETFLRFCQKHLLHWLEALCLLNQFVAIVAFDIILKDRHGLFSVSRNRRIKPLSSYLEKLIPSRWRKEYLQSSDLDLLSIRNVLWDIRQTPLQVYNLAHTHPDLRKFLDAAQFLGKRPRWLKRVASKQLPLRKRLRSVSVSPNCEQLAIGVACDIYLWDLRKPASRNMRKIGISSGEIYDLAFSPDSKQVASASLKIELHDITKKRSIFVIDEESMPAPKDHRRLHVAISFSRDGRLLASCSSFHSVHGSFRFTQPLTIQVRNLKTNIVVKEFQSALFPHRDSTIAFSPDASVVASSASKNGRWVDTVEIWNLQSGDRTHQFEPGNPGLVEGFLCFEDQFYVSTTVGLFNITLPESVELPKQAACVPVLHFQNSFVNYGLDRFYRIPDVFIFSKDFSRNKARRVHDNVFVFSHYLDDLDEYSLLTLLCIEVDLSKNLSQI